MVKVSIYGWMSGPVHQTVSEFSPIRMTMCEGKLEIERGDGGCSRGKVRGAALYVKESTV